MPSVPPGSLVLVTGASGFVGTQAVIALARAGFRVRAAVRSYEKGEYVKSLGADEFVVVGEMARPGAYDAAVVGVVGVVHASSKPDINNKGDPGLVIVPAIVGIQSLLNSLALCPTVRRIVQMGSAAALSTAQSGPTRHPHAEDEWNDAVVEQVKEQGASAPPPLKYHASKVVSERALWAFFAKRQPHFDGVALLVAYVLGPPTEFSTTYGQVTASSSALIPWMTRPMGTAALSEPFYPYVDSYDVGLAAVAALKTPAAGGERILFQAGPVFGNDFALAVQRVLHDPRLTPGNPDPVFRAQLEATAATFETTKARRMLGLAYTPKDACLDATVEGVRDVLATAKSGVRR